MSLTHCPLCPPGLGFPVDGGEINFLPITDQSAEAVRKGASSGVDCRLYGAAAPLRGSAVAPVLNTEDKKSCLHVGFGPGQGRLLAHAEDGRFGAMPEEQYYKLWNPGKHDIEGKI
jgi:hypothetical protein